MIDPAEIVAWRTVAGHSQTVAAGTVYMTRNGWAKWESGAREMPQAVATLYLLMTDQHPDFLIKPR